MSVADNLESIAGGIEDEDKLKAAKREAREELGIEAEKWTYLGVVESDTSITNSLCHLYLAQKLTFTKPKREATEDIETVKMKLEEAVEKVLVGEITHGQACILILKADKILSDED